VPSLGGVTFDVRGLVQLPGAEIALQRVPHLPARVNSIPVKGEFQRLHLLHGTVGVVPDGTVIAMLVVHYADGSVRSIPIRYGQDVLGLRVTPDSQAKAAVAWTGTAEDGAEIHLYRSTWENPQPGKTAVSIDLVSTMADSSPLIVALTLD
jgi:hypothetical protein